MGFNKQKLLKGFLYVGLILLAINVVVYVFEGEEGRLKRTIYKDKSFVERNDIIALAGAISKEYYDELGNDKRSLIFIAKTFLDDNKNIVIKIDDISVEINNGNGKTQVSGTFYWQGKSDKNILYDNFNVKADFKKEGRRWKLIELVPGKEKQKELLTPNVS